MAGYNGSGVYQIRYSFVQDAGNGIKILASRQDQQWTDMVGGFNNCLTRDAQGKPTANFDFNSFKGLNLATATLPGDAVPLAQVQALANAAAVLAQNEWVIDSHTPTFVANNQFKFTGVDLTGTYHAGRRVKVTHNTGASILYASIVSSAFGADTTVSIDSGALVSTVTAVAYSTQDSINASAPYRSAVMFDCLGGGNLTTGTQYTMGAAAPFATSSVVGDLLGELSSGAFTAKLAGTYLVTAMVGTNKNGATITGEGQLSLYVNGAQQYGPGPVICLYAPISNISNCSFSQIVKINAGDIITLRTANNILFTGGPVTGGNCFINITRVN